MRIKMTHKKQYNVQTSLPITLITNDTENYEEIILLLHGYSEDAQKIYDRLGQKLDHKKYLILAANGIFPLVDRFPLETKASDQKLLRGYAWYFYDQTNDHYLVDYDVPAKALGDLLNQINTKNLPVNIIGYSQGGYLAPFIANYHKSIKYILGINCSFRTDLLPKENFYKLDGLQGNDDPIINVTLSKSRHNDFINNGNHGDYKIIENESHRLSPTLINEAINLFNLNLN
jgi:predicted esterase